MQHSNIFSSIFCKHWCYGSSLAFLTSLMLLVPSKITLTAEYFTITDVTLLRALLLFSKTFPSTFEHSTIIDFWTFYHHRCYALRCSLQIPYILPSVMLCSKILFFFSSPPSLMLRFKIFSSTYKILASLMLCSKVFSPMFKHHRCYAIRLLFNFPTSFMLRCQIFWSVCLTFHHHGWCAIGTSLQFSNVLLYLHYYCALRSSLQFSNITDATH